MPARERQVWLDIPGSGPVPVTTATGVFGAQRVDQGTRVLIRQAPAPAACTGILDIGAGYGPISVAMALREPSAGVWALDVNRRALRLTARNAAALGARNVVPAEPAEVPAAVRFDRLYSNPPVKIGRDQMHDLLAGWLRRLARDGEAFLVVTYRPHRRAAGRTAALLVRPAGSGTGRGERACRGSGSTAVRAVRHVTRSTWRHRHLAGPLVTRQCPRSCARQSAARAPRLRTGRRARVCIRFSKVRRGQDRTQRGGESRPFCPATRTVLASPRKRSPRARAARSRSTGGSESGAPGCAECRPWARGS